MELYTQVGQNAILSLASHIFFIGVTLYAMQSLRLDQLFKKGRTFQIQLVYILLSITIGTAVSNFFLTFSGWANDLKFLF